VASSVLNLPSRVAGPHAERLHGLVDKLTGPAFSTSVGLLHWAQRESIAPPTRKGKKKSRTIDLGRGVEFFKRLLP
jgi:cell division protein FtsA